VIEKNLLTSFESPGKVKGSLKALACVPLKFFSIQLLKKGEKDETATIFFNFFISIFPGN
jgi:hypothetical protein